MVRFLLFFGKINIGRVEAFWGLTHLVEM